MLRLSATDVRRRTKRMARGLTWLVALAWLVCATPAGAQAPEAAKGFAPTGTLRVGVLMVTYFAIESAGELSGVVPDLGRELAHRLGVPVQLVKIENPVAMIAAFRAGELDATFIGITADRAAAFDY